MLIYAEAVHFVQVLDLEDFERSTALRHAIDAMLGLIASYEYLTSSFLHGHRTALYSSLTMVCTKVLAV